MTELTAQKRMAAKILKRGMNSIWMDEDKGHTIASAVTRDDVRKLIRRGLIKPRRLVGTSRGRARAQKFKKARGQQRRAGSRKGTANARNNKKRVWINKIRLQRKYLKELRDEEYITPKTYRMLYNQAKGNLFRSVRYLSNHIRETGLAEKRIPELKR